MVTWQTPGSSRPDPPPTIDNSIDSNHRRQPLTPPPDHQESAHRAAVPRALVHTCCEEVGLDPVRDADEVIDAMRAPPERECCDSGCDPCVLTILRAASLVKQRHHTP